MLVYPKYTVARHSLSRKLPKKRAFDLMFTLTNSDITKQLFKFLRNTRSLTFFPLWMGHVQDTQQLKVNTQTQNLCIFAIFANKKRHAAKKNNLPDDQMLALAEKSDVMLSLLYRKNLCNAKTYTARRDALHSIDSSRDTLQQSVRSYQAAQSKLELLGLTEHLEVYRPITKEDLKVQMFMLNPNERGTHDTQLS
ncbi:hypothetical protein C8Q75DRAFT_737353 [Abortiporus biennis]|nr:hypothetical protein C8Q75DRAFT_737353 [Abortiporus biennis]